MANYCGCTRTNYFRVTDEEKFNKIMNNCYGYEGNIHICFETDEKNVKRFMFYCESSIEGFENEDGDADFDGFCNALQSVLPENEAIIITEIGREKMRYLTGYVIVITRDEIRCKNLNGIGKELARDMLKNKNWDTKNEY